MTNEYLQSVAEFKKLQKQYKPSEFYIKLYENEPDFIRTKPPVSKIIDFFSGKTVFITGGTGFIGKLVVEKLLRACVDIKTIYLLIRTKKEKDSKSRVALLLEEEIFRIAREVNPNYKSIVVPIEGDAAEDNLQISAPDAKSLQDNVNVIIHCAATVRFDDHIRKASNINVKGTHDMIKLAKKCTKLESFVHVSTAYSNCCREYIDEYFYDPPICAEDLYETLKNHTDLELEKMTPSMIGEFPNTYVYTKLIAEDLIKRDENNLPICVFRPSVVYATYLEPSKGYATILGAVGITVGASLGILRTIVHNEDHLMDFVPADYVVNGIIAAAFETSKIPLSERTSPKIYNCVSGVENPLTWKMIFTSIRKHGLVIGAKQMLSYPDAVFTTNVYLHYFLRFFLHTVPAFIIDRLLILVNKKPILTKLYVKIHAALDATLYFTERQWTFSNTNYRELWNNLSEGDRFAFPFSMQNFDWDIYMAGTSIGLKWHVLKEPFDDRPATMRKLKLLFVLHNTIRIIFYYLVLLAISKIFPSDTLFYILLGYLFFNGLALLSLSANARFMIEHFKL